MFPQLQPCAALHSSWLCSLLDRAVVECRKHFVPSSFSRYRAHNATPMPYKASCIEAGGVISHISISAATYNG